MKSSLSQGIVSVRWDFEDNWIFSLSSVFFYCWFQIFNKSSTPHCDVMIERDVLSKCVWHWHRLRILFPSLFREKKREENRTKNVERKEDWNSLLNKIIKWELLGAFPCNPRPQFPSDRFVVRSTLRLTLSYSIAEPPIKWKIENRNQIVVRGKACWESHLYSTRKLSLTIVRCWNYVKVESNFRYHLIYPDQPPPSTIELLAVTCHSGNNMWARHETYLDLRRLAKWLIIHFVYWNISFNIHRYPAQTSSSKCRKDGLMFEFFGILLYTISFPDCLSAFTLIYGWSFAVELAKERTGCFWRIH